MMQFRHVRTLSSNFKTEGKGRFSHRITAQAWSSNNIQRLAVALSDNNIYLFDGNSFELMDRFPTKPADKTQRRHYSVNSLCYSPDGTRLAITQSDNIVFVYKLGDSWEDKKTICNKFSQDSSPTCICWPHNRPNEVVYGLENGEIKAGVVKLNKSVPLYSTQSYCVAIAALNDGHSVVSAHMDGNLYKYTFPHNDLPPTSKLWCRLPFTPSQVVVGEHVVVCGVNAAPVPLPPGCSVIGLSVSSNGLIPAGTNFLYISTEAGERVQTIAFVNEELAQNYIPTRPFSALAMAPSGKAFLCGGFDRFEAFGYNAHIKQWELIRNIASISNLYSISAMVCSADGSKLITGAVGGALDVFDVCVRRERYGGNYDFVYTSASSAVIHDLQRDSKISISCRSALAILRLDVYYDRYVVALTSETVIVADISKGMVSEVPIKVRLVDVDGIQRSSAKYLFDYDGACIIACDGAIHVVKYGVNSVLYSTRSEHCTVHTLSLTHKSATDTFVLAHLLDNHTIRATDLASKTQLASVQHENVVDWLELSPVSASKLLFRDSQMTLSICDLQSNDKSTICRNVEYVQWVPDANAIVALTNNTLMAWYNADRVNDVTVLSSAVNGTVQDIVRNENECYVLISGHDHVDNTKIILNNTLLSFSGNLKKNDLTSACRILESISGASGTTEAASIASMWTEQANVALLNHDYVIAQRCFAALKDVSKSSYLDKVLQINSASNGSTSTPNSLVGRSNAIHPLAQARIYALNKQWQQCINLQVESGHVNEAIVYCKKMHRWSDAVHIANTRNVANKLEIMHEYEEYLLQTHQEVIAGQLRENNGEYDLAVELYLRGGSPSKAAQCILKHNLLSDAALCDTTCQNLLKSSLFELCGDLYNARRMSSKALEIYRRGNCYNKAIMLCRQSFPQQVVTIEEEWGDSLLQDRQYESAISHYIEAHCTLKALHAAVEGKSWSKAMSLVRDVDARDAQVYYRRIGKHLEQVRKYDDAADMYRKGSAPQDAVQMFTKHGMWDRAYDIAKTFMGAYELTNLYVSQAQIVETQYANTKDRAKLAEAERLLVTVGEVDRAIEMYKRHHVWDDMVRVVEKHRPDLLSDTYAHLARRFDKENNVEMAETYYLRANDWLSVVALHRRNNNWVACLEISKKYGSAEDKSYVQVCYAFLEWARANGGEQDAIAYLTKNDMIRPVIEFYSQRSEWATAQLLAEQCDASYLPVLWFQHALALEDEGLYAQAEEFFLKADKPREAIEMYIHLKDWDRALQICETHDDRAFSEVYAAQAHDAVASEKYEYAEKLFIASHHPEEAIQMYKSIFRYEDALRIAQQYAVREVPALEREIFRSQGGKGASGIGKTAPVQQQQQFNTDTAEGIVQAANQAEMRGDMKTAVQLLSKLGPHLATSSFSTATMARHLQHGAKLAVSVLGDQARGVCLTISSVQSQMGEYEASARVLCDVGEAHSAVAMLCEQHQYPLAEQIALRFDDQELVNEVRRKNHQHMAEQGDVDNLATKNSEMAAEVYAKSGQWSKVLELAQKQGSEAVARYSVNHASTLVQEGKFRQALAVWAQFGCVATSRNLLLYRRVSQEICRLSEADGRATKDKNETVNTPNQVEAWPLLKKSLGDLLQQVAKNANDVQTQMQDNQNHHTAYKELLEFYKVALLKCRLVEAEHRNLAGLSARISTALLRYVSYLHSEEAFYKAGFWAKGAGTSYQEHAYVLLNRFADIYHLINDSHSLSVSNKEFADTEIPSPEKTPLPTGHAVSASDFDEIDMWLLDSIPSNPKLLTAPCAKCRRETFLGNVHCHVCRFESKLCAVTGLRLPSNAQLVVSCTLCSAQCNKPDFNTWVEATGKCPACEKTQQVQY